MLNIQTLFREPVFKDELLRDIVCSYTAVGDARIYSLCNLSRKIEEDNVQGDVIECGVCSGGTAAILAHFASRSKLNRKVWLLDSFKGMPETTEADGKEAKKYVGEVVGYESRVREVLGHVKVDMSCVKIVPGWFRDTLPLVTAPEIALLNIDADWYESVKLCLRTFYNRVVVGGIVSIDDYGHWPGCKKAVNEFFEERQLKLNLVEVDYTARWFRKLA